MSRMISAIGLTRKFGLKTALREVSFELHAGQITGLLGLNGAGKSTTLSLLTGRLQPDEGRVLIGDEGLEGASPKLRSRFGFLPEGAPVFEDLSVIAHLQTMAGLKSLSRSARSSSIESMLLRFELTDVRHTLIETLSKGFRRRVALAAACLGDPDILILDEPTDGLDPFQKDRVLSQLRRSGAHQALLISSHSLEDVETICDRVIVLKAGELVFDGAVTELASRHGAKDIRQAFAELHAESQPVS